ncbi:MAG: hypothetical protein K9I68_06160 [Bacteroidales bacterium]|nr:hypothetical protein [Bacteroidales bacterium]MCF8338140.1 hypothetical protein [Bacteroidales bacterium]
MTKKRRKNNNDDQVNLSIEEIEDKMEELREQEEYATLDNDELRVKAIELLFEEIDDGK